MPCLVFPVCGYDDGQTTWHSDWTEQLGVVGIGQMAELPEQLMAGGHARFDVQLRRRRQQQQHQPPSEQEQVAVELFEALSTSQFW